jgi:hypothetical protein
MYSVSVSKISKYCSNKRTWSHKQIRKFEVQTVGKGIETQYYVLWL